MRTLARALPFAAVVAASLLVGGCAIRTRTVVVARPAPTPVVVARPSATCTFGHARECSAYCARGSGTSCNNLGAMFELGHGVSADPPRALRLYRRACSYGAPAGCTNANRLAAR